MIQNTSTETIISNSEIHATTLFSQGLGLMFRKKRNLIMYFSTPRRISLHNFFVFYPLEIVVLNAQGKIVEINKQFRPYTFWRSSHKGMYCVELGLDASKGHCNVGDVLKITNKKREK